MTYNYHNNVIQSSFTALKNPLCSAYSSPFLHPGQPPFFTVSIAFPFPEWHVAGIGQYAAISPWLLSPGEMH